MFKVQSLWQVCTFRVSRLMFHKGELKMSAEEDLYGEVKMATEENLHFVEDALERIIAKNVNS